MMAYVYRHIRLDKNQPFYIGIGSDKNYSRAYWKHGRTRYWKNIVNKSGYDVEIILDNISWVDACRKEKEFILLYKKISDGGLLVNLTDGGDGTIGLKPNITSERNKKISETLKNKYASGERKSALKGVSPSVETRNKISLKSTGRKHTEETKNKLSVIKIGNKANLGKMLSVETRSKISSSHTGKRLSLEHKKKLSESHKGYKMPLEQKIKISNSLKNRNNNFQ